MRQRENLKINSAKRKGGEEKGGIKSRRRATRAKSKSYVKQVGLLFRARGKIKVGGGWIWEWEKFY